MRIQLSNGQLHFYQWDTGQSVKAPDGVETIHFRIDNDHAAPITVTNGWATVPDECFQSGDDLVYYAYDENHTTDSARVEVVNRPKPTYYVYTKTDIKTLEELDKRYKELENLAVAFTSAEADRKASETARDKAEKKREQDTQNAITDCKTATESALKAAATMMIVNDDTGKTYQGAIKVIGGKPVFEYDEVVTG